MWLPMRRTSLEGRESPSDNTQHRHFVWKVHLCKLLYVIPGNSSVRMCPHAKVRSRLPILQAMSFDKGLLALQTKVRNDSPLSIDRLFELLTVDLR